MSFRVFLSDSVLSMRCPRMRRTQHHFGQTANVLAGLRSIAQVQRCVVGWSEGQQASASTVVLCCLSRHHSSNRAPARSRSAEYRAGLRPPVRVRAHRRVRDRLRHRSERRAGRSATARLWSSPRPMGCFPGMNDPDPFDFGQLLGQDVLQEPWVDTVTLPIRERGKVP